MNPHGVGNLAARIRLDLVAIWNRENERARRAYYWRIKYQREQEKGWLK